MKAFFSFILTTLWKILLMPDSSHDVATTVLNIKSNTYSTYVTLFCRIYWTRENKILVLSHSINYRILLLIFPQPHEKR